MKYLQQLMIILGSYILGVVLQKAFNLPIPGTVLGLILLFLGLYSGIIKVEMVEDMCEILISHMSFLFIPAGVGLITSFNLLSGNIIKFSLVILLSTVIVWIVTGYVVKFLRKVCSK